MLGLLMALVVLLPRQEADVDLLIRDLDADAVGTRQKACEALLAAGDKAVDPLRAAAAKGSVELRRRIEQILRRMGRSMTPDPKAPTPDVAAVRFKPCAPKLL